MQNLKDIREAFKAYLEKPESEEPMGLTIDVLLEDSMVSEVLKYVLGSMKVEDTFSRKIPLNNLHCTD